jgi:hypothetical protein
VKRNIVSAILSCALLSSLALAQADPPSRFDISGNLSFNEATLPAAPSSTQVRAFGWQSSGVTRLSRWVALTSQFGSGYASSDSIQLVGYTGPGTMRHYSMLVGPRVTIPTGGRFSPFVEGLVGADRASTDLVSNGSSVTGSEIQIAYAFGGGTQINLSKHFGLNFEGQYFGTQHTIGYTGWEPSHLQIAAGIVFRMYGRGPQIAEQRPPSAPNSNISTQPVPEATVARRAESEAPVTSRVSAIQPATPNSSAELPVQPQAIAESNVRLVSTNQLAGTQTVVPGGQVVTPALQTAPSTPPVATPAAPVVAAALQANSGQRAPQGSAQASRPAVTAVAVVPQTLDQAPSQAPPISLGEYARRLREKKQQQNQ